MEKLRFCYKACRKNDVDAVRRALEDGFVVDSRDGYNNDTLLHVSARRGYAKIISLLLEYKANVNVQNKDGDTPLHESARCGCTEIVSLLLEYKADVNVQNMYSNTPLHESASFGHKEIVSLLLANMDNVNIKNNYGSTPLHYSVGRGYKEIVSMLLSKKAEVNVQDKGGMTPLHLSAESGQTEIVSLLLENKADVNVKCTKGLSPLDYTYNNKVADVLLKHGAVPYKQNFMGRLVSRFRFREQSQTTTTTRSVKVTVTPGVEDNKDRSASTSHSHTQTIEIKDEVTNTIRNNETTSDPALIYENTDQHKIPDPQKISTSEHDEVWASGLAGRVEQAATGYIKDFPAISSKCQPSISADVSTCQQPGATVVNINVTVNNNNEINILDTRDVKVQNAQIMKTRLVAYNSPIKVFDRLRRAWTMDETETLNKKKAKI